MVNICDHKDLCVKLCLEKREKFSMELSSLHFVVIEAI